LPFSEMFCFVTSGTCPYTRERGFAHFAPEPETRNLLIRRDANSRERWSIQQRKQARRTKRSAVN
jgi:hypothetical protein